MSEIKNYEWVKKTIESCINGFQLQCCKTIIILYKQRYPNSEYYHILKKQLTDAAKKLYTVSSVAKASSLTEDEGVE
jgi:hypothetical protein